MAMRHACCEWPPTNSTASREPTVKQGDAARHAREMASAIATVYQNDGYAPDKNRIVQFHDAAFSQAFEFIPDTALATVVSVTDAGSLPLLVAIDGQQFYKLLYDDFELRSNDVPITVCEMTRIEPEKGYVRVETQYDPSSAASAPTRLTGWTFGIGERFNLTFQTRFDPEDEIDQGEKFARALAAAMGWNRPTSE